jgi:hypothetical protein
VAVWWRLFPTLRDMDTFDEIRPDPPTASKVSPYP